MDDTISRQAAIDAMEQAKEQYFDRKVIIGKMQNVVSNLPSAQPEQRWIPCSERLPEEDGYYLVSEDDGGIEVEWYDNTGWGYCGVIAWMPMPSPYKEDGNEGR